MKLIASFVEVYHATTKQFTHFLNRPTWFSLNIKDAKGWHNYCRRVQNKVNYFSTTSNN